MTEAEVVAISGEPATAEVTTCGQDNNAPWSCKIWNYGRFKVLFQNTNSSKGWTVTSWFFSNGLF